MKNRYLATVAAAALMAAHSARAAEGDPPADVIAQATAEGEVVEFVCGDDGFVTVLFLLDDVLVSEIPSGTQCDPEAFDPEDPNGEEEEEEEEEDEDVEGRADGQAAADQVSAASQLFFPGLNANADLTIFFGLPVRTTGGVTRGRPEDRDEDALRRCLERVARLEAELAAAEADFAQAAQDAADLASGDEAKLEPFRLDAATQLGEREDRFEFSDNDASDFIRASRDLAAADLDPALADSILNDAESFNAALDAMREQLFANQLFVGNLSGQESEVAAEIADALSLPNVPASQTTASALQKALGAFTKGLDVGKVVAAAVAAFLIGQNNDEIRQSLVGDLRDAVDELNNAAALVRRVEALKQEILARRDARVANLLARREAERDRLDFEIGSLKRRIENEKAACARFAGGSQARLAPKPVEATFEVAREGRRAGDFALALDLASLAQEVGADPRLNLFVSAGVDVHDDRRRLIGMDGETISLSGGASYRVAAGLTLGLFGRYGHTELSGPGGEIEADTVSLGGFAEADLTGGFVFTGVAAYSWSDVDGTFIQGAVTTTGATEIDGFAFQAGLSKSFAFGDWTLTPAASLTYASVDQDGFTLSDGTAAPGERRDQLSLTAGPTISRSFETEGGMRLTPSLGLSGIVNLSGEESQLRADGSRVSSGAFGGALSLGLGVATPGGGAVSLTGGVSAFEGRQMGYSIGASGRIPLN